MTARTSGILRALAIAVLSTVMLLAWNYYHDAKWLHVGFGFYLGEALPIYADDRPVSLDQVPGACMRLMFAAAIAACAIGIVMLAVARRWRTSVCLLLTIAAVLTTNLAVASIPAGADGILAPFARRELEYFGDVRFVRNDPIRFIERYPGLATGWLYRLSHHAGTHPPGGVLFLWLGTKLLGPSLQAACALAIAFTALGVLPAYVLARTIGGAAAARRLLPLYVATPNLILFGATCMDGVFMTFALTAMAACFIAMRRWSIAWPIVAGALLWLATFMTYTTVAIPLLMGCYALVIATRRPREAAFMLARSVLVGIAFIASQAAATLWLNHDFRACVEAAMKVDLRGVRITGYDSLEIWRSFSLGNALAFLFGSGLATSALFFIALIKRHHFRQSGPRRLHAFAPTLAFCVVALACSTLFSMEVERVWLFLTPAMLIAGTLAFRGTIVWLLVPAMLLTQALIIEWNYKTWW